ncbi:EAL domain-containing protein [Erwinia sp. V90_4]|jgi:diguanylate cyclase (GGDEF)-like protein|uniref:putative bifunctional diguanylate cyclase/phosphodiesterase n=1 Tax=Erwinia TaxID=551 RepID=UPI001D8B3993|nr:MULTISPECIES: EAL domain-containing protein [Erwinia]MDI3440154.1 EAL domain-containing protein [Erwinia sp. V90_4]CAH0227030.1 putative signaling protein CC_0091 [Erwinia aphidicola]
MKIEHSTVAELRREFMRNVVAPVVAVVVFALLGCGFTAYWVTAQSNAKAEEKQQQVIENIFAQHLADFGNQHKNLLKGADLLVQMAKPDEFGSWLYSLAGDNEIYLMDAQHRPIAAWLAGRAAPLSRYGGVSQSLANWLHPAGGEDFTRDFIRLRGRVAEVVIGSLPGDRANRQLVFIRYLHYSFIDFLEHRGVVSRFRFIPSDPEQANSAGFLLTSQRGIPVSSVSWEPMRPGTQMLKVTGPLIAVAILSITLMCILMTHRLWFSSLKLSSSMRRLAASEAHARHLAHHDTLTGLPNRAWIEEQLNRRLFQLPLKGEKLALLLLDLDRFKMINDTYGHHTGDDLIVEIGQRLSRLLPGENAVGRLGGDEFVVMLSKIESEQQVAEMCQQIITQLAAPMTLRGHKLWVGVSIGVALAPEHSTDLLELMRKADISLYAAKAEGGGRYCLFIPTMDEALQKRQRLAQQLRVALENNNLGLMQWYQPIMDISGTKLFAVEALLRWQHPTLGAISPAEFVPIAEETGLIIPLGEWVIEQACRLATRCPKLIVAINVSPLQFLAPGFVDTLREIITRHNVNPRQIELEITEGVLLEDEQQALRTIRTLRAAGFCIALDDFGTGYSSLNYLIQFPVDTIKIDRAFIQSLGVRANSATIVKSVINLGHSLGITVTAEGVETEEQRLMLEAAGCDRLQGFLLSRPQPAEQLRQLLLEKFT